MKKEIKDKKSTKTGWIGKTATTAAMVAALGISLGVNVQKVYGGEAIQNSGVVQDKHCSEQGKIESQQGKIQSQQMKYKSQHLKIDATQHKTPTEGETR